LSIQGVGKTFPGVGGAAPTQALLPVGLEVADNDFITILGLSGCGKSTLLRLVAGLEEPSSGRILLDGAPVSGPAADRGMVFQSYTLFPWLTVRQNICFGLRQKGMAAAEQRAISDHFIGEIGLRGFEDHYPKQLSGGMQQRVAIARALAIEPDILLMDEPFSHLDAITARKLRADLMAIMNRARPAILFVTHDLAEAVLLSDHIYMMETKPARIFKHVIVDIARPRSPEDERVFALERELMREFFSVLETKG